MRESGFFHIPNFSATPVFSLLEILNGVAEWDASFRLLLAAAGPASEWLSPAWSNDLAGWRSRYVAVSLRDSDPSRGAKSATVLAKKTTNFWITK